MAGTANCSLQSTAPICLTLQRIHMTRAFHIVQRHANKWNNTAYKTQQKQWKLSRQIFRNIDDCGAITMARANANTKHQYLMSLNFLCNCLLKDTYIYDFKLHALKVDTSAGWRRSGGWAELLSRVPSLTLRLKAVCSFRKASIDV